MSRDAIAFRIQCSVMWANFVDMFYPPEASKVIMQYVAAASGKGRDIDRVKEQLLQSNPVLEGEWVSRRTVGHHHYQYLFIILCLADMTVLCIFTQYSLFYLVVLDAVHPPLLQSFSSPTLPSPSLFYLHFFSSIHVHATLTYCRALVYFFHFRCP